MEPMFSVIVPVYRAEEYLERCIESIIKQNYSDFELLLVDDMSPDRCPEICDMYAKVDSRIKVFHQNVPGRGAVAARNVGTRHAKGKYICYVDADDWVADSYFETLQKYILEYQEPDIISFNFYYVCANLNPEKVDSIRGCTSWFYDREQMIKEIYPFMIYDPSLSFFNGKVYPVPWNKIYKKELLKGVYGSDERLTILEDNPYTFQHLYEADSLSVCEDYLYYYWRNNDSSVTSQYIPKYLEQIQLVYQYIDEHLAGKEPSFAKQINVYKVAWLITSIFHEVRYGKNKKDILLNIRKNVGKSPLVHECRFYALPLYVKVYLLLVKMHFFRLVVLLARTRIKITG